MLHLLEKAAIYTRNEFKTNQSSVWDVPDWILILDLEGFNMAQHGCMECKLKAFMSQAISAPAYTHLA